MVGSSRQVRARKGAVKPATFWCQYGDHQKPVTERTEQHGVRVCAECKEHWQQREAELDAIEAEFSLRESAPANDTSEQFAGVAVDEMVRDLAHAAAVLRVPVPEGFDGWSAMTLTAQNADAFASGSRAVFLACFRGYHGQGLHKHAADLVRSVSDGMVELRRWVDAQRAERVAVAS